MLVRTIFRPSRIWQYVKLEIIVATVIAAALVAAQQFGLDLSVPFGPLGVLGSAVAITMGFRNNTAYARWWEAQSAWGTISNISRQYARLIVTFARSHSHQTGYDEARADAFIQSALHRQIAWIHVLRHTLRREPLSDDALMYLDADEKQLVIGSVSPATTLLLRSGQHIYAAMANGTLQGFDSFQLEGCLSQLQIAQGSCEQIKNTPMPRQYAFFTTAFSWIFIVTMPFGLLSQFDISTAWVVIPLSIILTFAFTIIDKIGQVTEEPFEGRVQDVPMTAICRDIERELLEVLGAHPLPPAMEPHDGYLM